MTKSNIPSKFSDDAKITILVKAPKRAGTATAKQFAKLKNGMTVAEAREKAGYGKQNLRWDIHHGYLKVR